MINPTVAPTTDDGAKADSAAPISRRQERGRVRWDFLIPLTIIHLGALLACLPIFFTWKGLATLFVLHLVCGLGVTVGYHRLLTHRSFKTLKPIEYLLSWLGSINLQGGPVKWIATHRLHHQHSDQEEDPHSPVHGFFWSHMRWIFTFDPKFDEYKDYSQYALDIARDPGHALIERVVPFSQLFFMGLLYLWGWSFGGGMWGGFSCVVWGGFLRLVLVYHSTWLVNSATHTWGYRNFETNEKSTNLWWVSLFALGEGWHNNHHAYPNSARHGMKRWELDISWMTIRLMSFIGLARDIRLPSGAPTLD